MLISYERAKAESLGFSARGGLMERAERMVLLGVGLAFDILVPVLWVMLVLTAVTAVHRFVMVWRQATPPPADGTASHRAPTRGGTARTAGGSVSGARARGYLAYRAGADDARGASRAALGRSARPFASRGDGRRVAGASPTQVERNLRRVTRRRARRARRSSGRP